MSDSRPRRTRGPAPRLLWKLLAINVLVLAVALVIVWLAFDYLAADYFMTLIEEYSVEPTVANKMFLLAAHRSLIWAALAAVLLAVVLSVLLLRPVLRPLSRMTAVSARIADGDYARPALLDVPDRGPRDEIGELYRTFNRMADSLYRIEQLRRTMVTDVAHELRTPLTNLCGYLEGLIDGVVPPSVESFRSLHEETVRLARWVDATLDLAKAESSEATLRLRQVALAELLDGQLAVHGDSFAAKQIDVAVDLDPDAGAVLADRERLVHVLRNLLDNAHQYTPRGGQVTVSASREGEQIRVAVANVSDELADGELPLLFERFYRGEKSRSRAHGGVGIGLAIVKALVEAHGGRVGAERTGNVNRFWFTVPAAHAPHQPARPRPY